MVQAHIFVWHDASDATFAAVITRALTAAGADVLTCEDDDPTTPPSRTMLREIATRTISIVLLSAAALATESLPTLLEAARGAQRRMPERLPLAVTAALYDPASLANLPALSDLPRVEESVGHPRTPQDTARRLLHLLALDATALTPTTAPTTPQDALIIGKALLAQGRPADAIAPLESALQAIPQSVEGTSTLATALFDTKHYAAAADAYQRALALDPRNAMLWSRESAALNASNHPSEAITAAERAVALDPGLAPAWNEMGIALKNLGRHAEALLAYDRARALNPRSASAWYNQGLALHLLNRYDEAVVAYDQALALAPTAVITWNNKAMALLGLRRYDDAAKALTHALALDPTSATVWDSRGELHRARGDLEGALACFDRALELDPSFVASQANRAATLLALSDSSVPATSHQRAPKRKG